MRPGAASISLRRLFVVLRDFRNFIFRLSQLLKAAAPSRIGPQAKACAGNGEFHQSVVDLAAP